MIIVSILLGLFIIGIIGFAVWFMIRTPEHLRGYYAVPVNILVGVVSIVIVAICVFALIGLF